MGDVSAEQQEDYEVWIWISRTRDAMWKVREKGLESYGISVRQSGILLYVHSLYDRATPAEISRRFNLEPHSVSEHLKRMETAGLVKKVRDLGRKNMVRIKLTKKGLEAYRKSIRREHMYEIISSLSGEERRLLKSCLKKLREKALTTLGGKGDSSLL